MIYTLPLPDAALDQGDLIDGCSLLETKEFRLDQVDSVEVRWDFQRVILLTQTCDFANQKTTHANAAQVFDAQRFVDQGMLKPGDIRGPLRAGRIWGL